MKKAVFLYLITLFTWTQALYALDKLPYIAKSIQPHNMTVLEHGADSFIARLELIESAKKSIEIEYFIYSNDKVGRLLTQALVKAARRGVKVRILLDYFSTVNTITPMTAALLAREGIEVKFYNTASIIRVRKSMHRNHRKILLVDDSQVILGGRNLADEYFDFGEDYNFMDRDVILKGSIVKVIKDSFEIFWKHDLSVKRKIPRRPLLKFKQKIYDGIWRKAHNFLKVTEEDNRNYEILKEQSELWRSNRISGYCPKITFATSKPGIGSSSEPGKYLGALVYKKFQNASKDNVKSILIDSAYFLLDPQLKRIIKDLVKNNVDVDILTNSAFSSDVFVMAPATNSSVRRSVRFGADLYLYDGKAPRDYPLAEEVKNARWGTHTKSLIIGDDTFMVGSYNLDPRAKHINAELAVFCEGAPDLTSMLIEHFDSKKELSTLVTSRSEYWENSLKGTSLKQKVNYYLTAPLSNMLRPLF